MRCLQHDGLIACINYNKTCSLPLLTADKSGVPVCLPGSVRDECGGGGRRRVVVMERLEGAPLTDLAAIRRVTASNPVDAEETLINALNVWFGSVFMCRTFHAGAAPPPPPQHARTHTHAGNIASLVHIDRCIDATIVSICVLCTYVIVYTCYDLLILRRRLYLSEKNPRLMPKGL